MDKPKVLDSLTAEQLYAIRSIIRIHLGTNIATRQKLEEMFPIPAQLRTEMFDGELWRINNGVQEFLGGDGWRTNEHGPILNGKEDALRWLDLWNNPTEES